MAGTGHRIKNLRLSLQLSQAEFADSIGISQPLLSYIENEKVPPGIDVILNLVAAYGHNGVTYETLLESGSRKIPRALAHISRNLRVLMQLEQVDASQLATLCRLLPARVAAIQNGSSLPTLEEALVILQRFDRYSPDWLLLNREPMLRADAQHISFEQLKDELLRSMQQHSAQQAKPDQKK